MKVLKESADNLKHEFTIEIPSKDIESKVEESLLEYGKTAKISGFRPGKIPLNILKKKYDGSARKDAINEVVKDSLTSLLKDKSLEPATQPKIDISSYKIGENLTFTLAVETLPRIKLDDVTKLSINALSVKLNDKDVEEHLISLLEAQGRTQPVKKARKCKEGDTIVISADAFEKGTAVPEQNIEDFHLPLDGKRLPEFEKALMGKSAGETADIEFTLPENFPNKDFAGKTLVYKTTLKEVREPAKAELTEEVAKEFNFDNLEAMKDEARKQLTNATEEPIFLHQKRQILDSFAKSYTFDLPESLLEEEFNMIWEQAKHEIEHESKKEGNKKPDKKEMDKLEKKYHDLAERRVRLGLVLSAYGKEEKISVPKEKLTQAVIAAARQHRGQEKEAFDYYMKNPEAQAQIRAPLLEDEVITWIVSKAKVKTKEVSLEDFRKEIESLSDL